jgi:hypothetical protein
MPPIDEIPESATAACVGNALARGGSVVMRRMAIGSGEAGEGKGKDCRWPDKPERNISSLNQTRSKTPKATGTKKMQ